MDFALIPLQTLPENLRQELEKELQKQKEEALRALLTGKTPKKVIYKRPARGGQEVDYIPGWWFIQQANLLFSHLWSQEVKRLDIGENFVQSIVRVTVHVPGSTIIEEKTDGTRVITEYKPLDIVKEQCGGSDIKKYTKNAPTGKQIGDIIDIGDDMKSATTDGMKKCFTLMGLGADVYGKRETSTDSQSKILLELAKKKGVDGQKLLGMTQGKAVDELDDSARLILIGQLRKLPDK